ncbi:protein arginine kinase [Halanaerobium hydrogeniformans]|uniref:ATP:guanido phosphotransferase n=1 Tax=Halanaerobium hydrogeniformans TaxID=656519 RepID=E4RJE8_HALHG|nr:protein arginine kinase [Halanaerobium hydrogeniformans]ADQ15368.1 ATP:guanido phosphotransferase [Halanaerobium hydrogeniformans]
MNQKIFDNNWLIESGNEKDVVLISRIRLARNLKEFNFPNKATLSEKEKIIDELQNNLNFLKDKNFHLFKMEEFSSLERDVLHEKNLISKCHSENIEGTALILNNKLHLSTMVNEEDHLRIQVFGSGLDFTTIWQIADQFDDQIESEVEYAFSNKWGYLTSCPTNVGTALRASVMCHLPALVLSDRINEVLGAVGKFGLTVRGVFGEGSGSAGELFQISNQVTLGYSEKEIIDNLKSIILQIIREERRTRLYLVNKNYDKLKDNVLRSLGILKYAHSLKENEALNFLSKVKFGLDSGLIEEEINKNAFSELIFKIRTAHLQLNNYNNKEQLNIKRAELIRNSL